MTEKKVLIVGGEEDLKKEMNDEINKIKTTITTTINTITTQHDTLISELPNKYKIEHPIKYKEWLKKYKRINGPNYKVNMAQDWKLFAGDNDAEFKKQVEKIDKKF